MKPALSPRPAPPARGWSALALVAGLVLVAMTGLACWHLQRQRESVLKTADEASLRGAQSTFEQLLERERQHAVRLVSLLADDSRVRATALAPHFDEATVGDVLQDLRTACQASLMAVLDGSGKVRAQTGLSELAGADLSSAAAVRSAPSEPAIDVWTIGSRVFVVALAPIRSGAAVSALLLSGSEIGAAALQPIEQAHGVRAALLVGPKIVARTPGPGDAVLDAVFAAAGARAESSGRVREAGGEFLYRVSDTSPAAASARALWVLPARHLLAAATPIAGVWWLPILLAGLLWLLVLALVRL